MQYYLEVLVYISQCIFMSCALQLVVFVCLISSSNSAAHARSTGFNALVFFFFCIARMVDGPQRAILPVPPIRSNTAAALPSYECLWSLSQSRKIFPSLPGSCLMIFSFQCVLCVFSSHPFWTSSSLDVPAGVTHRRKVTQDF